MEDNKPSIQVTINIDGSTTIKKVKMDSFVIGRHADSDVNVLHPQVSRQHLRVSIIDDKIYCEDLGSSNGTFKDSIKIEPKKSFILEPQETLQLGDDGPIIQVQIEEKKQNTSTLSKIESLIGPIITGKPATPAPAPVAKVVQVAHSVASVASVLPQIPTFNAASATPPSVPIATKELKESEKTIQEANKQAGLILQQAEVKAEAKLQAAYKHTIETEQRAEKFYQDRLKEANTEAEKVYQVTRQENQKLLQEARAKSEALRQQAEDDARSLRKSTEEKCADFLKQAEKQGEELKAKRLSEADEIIEKKGQDILKAAHESIEKQKTEALKNLDSIKAQASRAREQKAAFDQEIPTLEKNINEMKAQFKKNQEESESTKVSLEKLKTEEKSLAARLEGIKKETKEQEKTQLTYKVELEKSAFNLASLKQEKEKSEKEINAQLQTLREKIEQEKEIINKKEIERINQLKFETSETIKKFEKQLIEDVIGRKNRIAKEVLLHIEATCNSVALNEEWKSKHSDLNSSIQDIIYGSNETSVKKVLDGKSTPSHFTARSKEKAFSLMLGLFIGIFAITAFNEFSGKFTGNSPVERMVANAADAAKVDLEKRKYNPAQTPEVRGNYVDSVIFTEKFSETYNDTKFQEAWTKAATMYLLKTWRLDEDRSTKVLAASAALVKDLAERKDKIHPDFIKKGVIQMREVEKETLARLKTELGGEVRLESYKKFEKKFFEKYDRTPASPSGQ